MYMHSSVPAIINDQNGKKNRIILRFCETAHLPLP